MGKLLRNTNAYEFHPAVDSDIEAIISYIKEDSIDAALRVLDRITERIESLLPQAVRHQGHRRLDLTDRPMLFVNVYDYLIACVPDKEPMQILAVLHGMREPRALAALLKERR